jgi:hypothetical protein
VAAGRVDVAIGGNVRLARFQVKIQHAASERIIAGRGHKQRRRLIPAQVFNERIDVV